MMHKWVESANSECPQCRGVMMLCEHGHCRMYCCVRCDRRWRQSRNQFNDITFKQVITDEGREKEPTMTTTKEQLPPCPFCRGTEFTMKRESWGPNKVRCLTCGAEGPDKLGENLAREAWSRRAVSRTEQGSVLIWLPWVLLCLTILCSFVKVAYFAKSRDTRIKSATILRKVGIAAPVGVLNVTVDKHPRLVVHDVLNNPRRDWIESGGIAKQQDINPALHPKSVLLSLDGKGTGEPIQNPKKTTSGHQDVPQPTRKEWLVILIVVGLSVWAFIHGVNRLLDGQANTKTCLLRHYPEQAEVDPLITPEWLDEFEKRPVPNIDIEGFRSLKGGEGNWTALLTTERDAICRTLRRLPAASPVEDAPPKAAQPSAPTLQLPEPVEGQTHWNAYTPQGTLVASTPVAGEVTPLCPVHARIDKSGTLEMQIGGNNCVACSLNERQQLLDILAPFAPTDASEDSLTVLRRLAEFYATHVGENRVVVSYPAATPPAVVPAEEAEEVERLRHERNALGSAIAEAGLKAGIYNGEVPLTGPHLIMLCEDMADEIIRLRAATTTPPDAAPLENERKTK